MKTNNKLLVSIYDEAENKYILFFDSIPEVMVQGNTLQDAADKLAETFARLIEIQMEDAVIYYKTPKQKTKETWT